MYLKLDEDSDVEAILPDYVRQDPGVAAAPYEPDRDYEGKAGEPLAPEAAPAAPEAVAKALMEVFDPELPSNIYDLGLVYDINVGPNGDTRILMTLTSPACPVAGTLPGTVAEAAAKVPGIGRVGVELVFDPPWNVDMLSGRARIELNLF